MFRNSTSQAGVDASDRVGFNGTSTQFRSLAPSLTRKAGTESPTVKETGVDGRFMDPDSLRDFGAI